MPKLVFPPKITADQLKQIARLCGNSRSGTKAAITDRIIDDLNGFSPLAPGTRVLSIDLGIRNLAYSLLEVPVPPDHQIKSSGQITTRRKRTPGSAKASNESAVPILHAWERLALVPKTPKPSNPPRKTRKKSAGEAEDETLVAAEPGADASITKRKKKNKPTKSKDNSTSLPPDSTLEAAMTDPEPGTIPVSVEDFSPARLSQLAVDLILERLLPLRPDIVTLERQRFRTVGGSGVFEWTLRVNSLESMLYAVLSTLRSLGHWPDGRVEAVAARGVLEFMAAQEGLGDGGADSPTVATRSVWVKKARKDDNKRLKKDIVGRMLQSGEGIKVAESDEGAVEALRREYVAQWSGSGKRGKAGVESLKKLDDLADCLLQGIAFIRWQDNKQRLLEGGVEALENQMVDE